MDSMKRKDQAVAHALRNWEEFEKQQAEQNDRWVRACIARLPPEEREQAEKRYEEGYYDYPNRNPNR